MNLFFKIYTTVIWSLSYFPINNPSPDSVDTVSLLLSVPGILNAVHCVCLLLELVEASRVMVFHNSLISHYMLYSVLYYVGTPAVLLIRLTTFRSSACLFHAFRYRRTGSVDNSTWGVSKTSITVPVESPTC